MSLERDWFFRFQDSSYVLICSFALDNCCLPLVISHKSKFVFAGSALEIDLFYSGKSMESLPSTSLNLQVLDVIFQVHMFRRSQVIRVDCTELAPYQDIFSALACLSIPFRSEYFVFHDSVVLTPSFDVIVSELASVSLSSEVVLKHAESVHLLHVPEPKVAPFPILFVFSEANPSSPIDVKTLVAVCRLRLSLVANTAWTSGVIRVLEASISLLVAGVTDHVNEATNTWLIVNFEEISASLISILLIILVPKASIHILWARLLLNFVNAVVKREFLKGRMLSTHLSSELVNKIL